MVREADIKEANEKKSNDPPFKTINWERTCTDKLCCLIFIAFIGSIIGLTGYAFTNGDPRRIITPFDSVGNLCGNIDPNTKIDYTLFPYKHMTGLVSFAASGGKDKSSLFYAVCVKECPALDAVPVCVPNDDVKTCPKQRLYGTIAVQGLCLPNQQAAKDTVKLIMEQLQNDPNFGTMTQYIQQISVVWKEMLYMCLASVLISIIYIFLLKWITKPLLYISMLLILFMFGALGGWSYMQREKYYVVPPAGEEATYVQSKDYRNSTIGAGVAWAIGFIYLCFMCCCWKNISLGATIMESASEFVSSNLSIITLPLMSYVTAMLFFAYWLATALFLYSVGQAQFKEDSFLANIVWKKETRYMLWYFLFGLFWIFSFLICQQQMIIACMVCQWYFSGQGENSDAPGSVSLRKSIGWGLWYHCGTVAFGSFCIAVITMIRVVFEYIVAQYEKAGAKENPVFKAIACCVRGVLYLLDQYVKFISKNAFIQTAIHNTSFCTSAWQSFYLIVRHAGRFTSAGAIGFIMMLLGKGTIMSTTAYLTILFIKQAHPDVNQPFVPAFLVAMVAYVVASLFLSIFSFSCTAILHCFIMAEDSPDCAAVSPKGLQAFLDTQDKSNIPKKTGSEDKAGSNPVE